MPTRPHWLALVALAAVGLDAASSGLPQVSSVTETPLRALGPDAAARQSSSPDTQTTYYANVIPAQPGDNNTDRVEAMPGYQFAAVRILVSVAPAVFAGLQDMSGKQTTGSLGALRHLNAHITVKPLDGTGQLVDVKRGGPVKLSTLEISPSEPTYSDAQSNKAQFIQAAANEAVKVVKPPIAGDLVQDFLSSYHRPPTTTQVAYMTETNAFGWRWYESPGATIEGLHNGTVLFQVADEVKALRITVDLVADWRAFGAWTKSFTFTYTLGRPPG